MGFLHVSLFGTVRVIQSEEQKEVKLSRSIQGLFAYLILYRHRTHPRDVLADLFWGEKNQELSRSSLNTAIWQLRNGIESSGVPRGMYLVSPRPDEIGFNQHSSFWLDVQAFDEGTGLIISQPAEYPEERLLQLENAISLYQGDLLEGFYDDWVLRERDNFRGRYLSALICLMHIYRNQGKYEKSLSCGQKILEMDPLREEIHRYLMELYLETGRRVQAVRQYEICREILMRELHIEPMIETQLLYEKLTLTAPHTSQQHPFESSNHLQQALTQLQQAKVIFEQARDQLDYSIKAVENALEIQKKQNK